MLLTFTFRDIKPGSRLRESQSPSLEDMYVYTVAILPWLLHASTIRPLIATIPQLITLTNCDSFYTVICWICFLFLVFFFWRHIHNN